MRSFKSFRSEFPPESTYRQTISTGWQCIIETFINHDGTDLPTHLFGLYAHHLSTSFHSLMATGHGELEALEAEHKEMLLLLGRCDRPAVKAVIAVEAGGEVMIRDWSVLVEGTRIYLLESMHSPT